MWQSIITYRMLAFLAFSVTALQPAVPDCSLNGEKNAAGVCVCDKPWTGSVCSTMNFKPVTFPQGAYTRASAYGGTSSLPLACKCDQRSSCFNQPTSFRLLPSSILLPSLYCKGTEWHPTSHHGVETRSKTQAPASTTSTSQQ